MNVLLIEDNPEYTAAIEEILAESECPSCNLQCVDRLQSGLQRLGEGEIDVVLLDLSLPDSNGLTTLLRVQAKAPHVPIVVLTATEDEAFELQAVHAGAQDYLVKVRTDGYSLMQSLRHAVERYKLLVMLDQQVCKLQVIEDDLHNIITSNADGMVIVDKNGTICLTNPAAEALFGRSGEELLSQNFGFPVVKGETTELGIIRGNGEIAVAEMRVVEIKWRGEITYLASLRDITRRKQAEKEREELVAKLQDAMAHIKTLSGLIPICGRCKKIRDEKGRWHPLETYVRDHSDAQFTDELCPNCYDDQMTEIRQSGGVRRET